MENQDPQFKQFPILGVVIVTFNSSDVIVACIKSLVSSVNVILRVVVVDNSSNDDTVRMVRDLLTRINLSQDGLGQAEHTIVVLESGVNAGFAAGVNLGLQFLSKHNDIDRFWILNPDCVVPEGTAAAFANYPEPPSGFSLMGGRVLYLPSDDIIQIDGGVINRKTGVTGNLHQYAAHVSTPVPRLDQMDFITGASMIVSRRFYEKAGPMPEDYFLYYEEVDWALRRGDLPLLYCPGGVVYHHAGTAIGSAALGRPASPFSIYFMHRARLRFVRRYFPYSLFHAYAFSFGKAAQLLLKGFPCEAWTLLYASFGLPPSADIRARLSPEAAQLAFGPVVRKAASGRKR